MSRTLVTVPASAISVPERLRPVDDAWAAEIATSIKAHGQIEPVTVRRDGEALVLVAGAHRLAACRLLNRTVDAIVIDADALAARLMEIDENLIRRELSAIDRAVFLSERKALWEEMHPASRHGGDRRSKNQTDKMSVWSFASDVAEKTGLHERSIRRDVALAKAFSPAELAVIRGSQLADNATELHKLRQATPEQRRIFFAALKKDTRARFGKVFAAKERKDGDLAAQRLIAGFLRLTKRQKGLFLVGALRITGMEAAALVERSHFAQETGAP